MRERQNTRSSLFLIELILAILFFSLASAVCVQVFVKAHFISQSAAELTLGANCASSAAEVLTHTDGSYEAFKELFPQAQEDDGEFYLCYDQDGKICEEEDAVYYLRIQEAASDNIRSAHILFTDKSGNCLYRLDPEIRIPRTV